MSLYWVEVGLGASVGGYILLRPRGMEKGGRDDEGEDEEPVPIVAPQKRR